MKKNEIGILFGVFLLLLSAALIWFLTAGEDYYDYAAGAAPSTANLTAPSEGSSAVTVLPKLNTEVKFRSFFLTFPGAEKVELQADFNAWGKVPLLLKAYGRGYFEISVALAAGDYKYVFVVDGKDVLDPNNLDRIDYEGRAVCIKTVK